MTTEVHNRVLAVYLSEQGAASGSPDLTTATLEVLACVAFKQPISHAEVDQLFDADKRGHVVKLRDFKLVEEFEGADGRLRLRQRNCSCSTWNWRVWRTWPRLPSRYPGRTLDYPDTRTTARQLASYSRSDLPQTLTALSRCRHKNHPCIRARRHAYVRGLRALLPPFPRSVRGFAQSARR